MIKKIALGLAGAFVLFQSWMTFWMVDMVPRPRMVEVLEEELVTDNAFAEFGTLLLLLGLMTTGAISFIVGLQLILMIFED